MENIRKISIIVVDNNKEFCNILNDYLLNQKDIVINGIANNKVEALKLIQEKNPDLVILDIYMANLDGLAVLKALDAMDLDPMPRIIVLSSINQDKTLQRAMALGADLYVVKPFDLDIFIKVIRQLFKNTIFNDNVSLSNYENSKSEINKSQSVNMTTEITNIMHKIGIPNYMKGYTYLKEAISIVLEDTRLLTTVTKELYPLIGEKFNTTNGKVERTISHVIEFAWRIGQVETINKILGYPIYSKEEMPSNFEFITMVADKLKLENKAS